MRVTSLAASGFRGDPAALVGEGRKQIAARENDRVAVVAQTDQPGLECGGVERVLVETRECRGQRLQHPQERAVIVRARLERRGVWSQKLDAPVLRVKLQDGEASRWRNRHRGLGSKLEHREAGARL